MVPVVLLGVLPQPFQQVMEGVCAHDGFVNGDVGLPHVSKGLVKAAVELPACAQDAGVREVALLLLGKINRRLMAAEAGGRLCACLQDDLAIANTQMPNPMGVLL